MTIATRKLNQKTNSNVYVQNSTSATTCACGNTKRASKPTCTLCSFIQYIRGTQETIPTKVCACGKPKKAGAISCSECDKALRHYLERRTQEGGFNKEGFLKSVREKHGIGVAGKCSLCSGNYIFGGNNPQPVIDDYDARCCDRCDHTIVTPARLKNIIKHGRAY